MDSAFGNRLKKLRLEKKLIQKQVALELNISEQRYSSYETNYKTPEVEMLIRLAKYYNVSVDYLLGLDNQSYIDKIKVHEKIRKIKEEINNLEEYVNNSK